ncbi:MAG: phage tail sheath subtilisin-like domain-containing protein [Chloroflexi bacterium]|nr:phage tail sheath subtilisin-like domain-containing protein [Chloroflexota bacterium]
MAYKVPGVYTTQRTAPNIVSLGLETKVLALVGTAPKGSDNPLYFYSAADAFAEHGSPADAASAGYTLPLAIQLAFENNAQVVCVARAGAVKSSHTFLSGVTPVITFTAAPHYAGTSGNSITVAIAAGTLSGVKVTVTAPDGVTTETFDNLADNTAIVNAVNQSSAIVTAAVVAATPLADIIVATALSGGNDGKAADSTALQAAITNLETKEVDIVAIMAGDTTTLTAAKTHVDTMSSSTNRKERILIAGLARGSTSTQVQTQGTNFADGRCVVVAPATLKKYNPSTQLVELVDGFYLAAAIGGLAAGLSPEMPLTRRAVNGFDSLADIYTVSTMNTLAENGVMVIHNSRGIRVRHGLTTAAVGDTFSELSVRRADDHVRKYIREALDSFVGQPSRVDTAVVIREAAKSALTELVNKEKIAAWASVTCTQNAVTPTQYDVIYSYKPAWPVNFIEVSYSIEL